MRRISVLGRDLAYAPRREAGESCPVESGPRVGLAAGRDVAMPHDIRDRIDALQRSDEPCDHRVLRGRIRLIIGPLELDPDRKIVAALAAFPRRDSRVPCALVAGDELHEFAVAA